MDKLSYNNLLNLEYKYIFDYYDTPLSFIGYINKKNYLFYFIEDDKFFITELTLKTATRLSQEKNLTRFYSFLLEKDLIKIITLNHDDKKIQYSNIEDEDFDVIHFLPKSDREIDYDYFSKNDIHQSFDLLTNLEFPFETRDITIRLIDQQNSSTMKLSVIESITEYMRNSFNVLKDSFQSVEDIYLKPYTEGSFKMNFIISSDNSLFSGDATFSPVLDILQEVNLNENRELNFNIVEDDADIKLLENVSKVYEEMKKDSITVEFYGNKINSEPDLLTKLSPSPVVDNNIAMLEKAISEKNKVNIQDETKKIDATRFVTGSILYNTATIELYGKNQKIKFEKDLFKQIKARTASLNLDKQVSVDLTIKTSTSPSGEVISQKFIVDSYRYI